MEDDIFVLRHIDDFHMSQESLFFFTGPRTTTQARFQQTCDELLEQAAMIALDKAGKQVILWIDVVSELLPLLEQRGYKLLSNVKEACFEGLSVVSLSDKRNNKNFLLLKKMGPLIVEHNEKIENLVEIEDYH